MSANVCNEYGIICSLANANGHCRVSACYNKKVDYVPFKEAVPKPNKDLVEVVRCKECKHNYNKVINHGKMQPRCDFTDRVLTENDYCSRGEREGE